MKRPLIASTINAVGFARLRRLGSLTIPSKRIVRLTSLQLLLLRVVPSSIPESRERNSLAAGLLRASLGFPERDEFTGLVVPAAEPALTICFITHDTLLCARRIGKECRMLLSIT